MAVAMRTNNYFELRNREMGFYTELRTAIILARINVDRTALRLFRERANAIRRVLANRYRGEGEKKRKNHITAIYLTARFFIHPSRSKRIGYTDLNG